MNSLRQIRMRKGLTLQQLSGKASVSLRTLGEYEAGQRDFTLADLRKLSKVLFVDSDEITRPAPEPQSSPNVEAPPPAAEPPTPKTAVEAPTQPPSAKPPAPPETFAQPAARPAAVAHPSRPPAPKRPAPAELPPPQPPTPGQIQFLDAYARALGLDDAALADMAGKPREELTRSQARRLIGELMARAKEAGLRVQTSAPTVSTRMREQTDHESLYLAEKRDQGAVLDFHLFGGEQFRGRVLGFTPYEITIRQEDDSELTLRKLAITYWRVEVATSEAAR